MFYVLIALKNELYYLEELDVIVLMEQEGTDLYVLDILSTKKTRCGGSSKLSFYQKKSKQSIFFLRQKKANTLMRLISLKRKICCLCVQMCLQVKITSYFQRPLTLDFQV